MIKKVLYIVSIITVLLIASCSNDTHLEKEVGADYLFSLSLQTNYDVNTRAETEPGVEDLHENKVEKVELFFYNGDALIWQVPKSAFTMTDGVNTTQKKLIIRVPNEITTLLNNTNVTLLAIANGPESAVMANKSLQELKKVVFASNDMNINRQYGFLMEGDKMTGNIVFDAVEPFDLGALTLKRAAAKLRLKINKLAVPEYEAGVATSRIVNYLDQTNLLKTDQVVYAPKSTKYVDLVEVTVEGETFLTTTIPYYSYENNWNADGSRETFILLEIPFTKDEITKRYFYRIPINYRLGEGGSEVRRNQLYEISVSISQLGATSGEMPFDVASSVEVKPWESVDIIQAELLTANYLVVKDKLLVMADVAEAKIEYLSNSKVTFIAGSLKAKFIAYDTSGTPSVGSPTPVNMPKITFVVENNKKYLKVVSAVPTNYVPLEIEFLVINEGGLTEEIRITQYPRKYVIAKKSNGDFYYGTEAGPGDTHKNKNLFRVTSVVSEGTIIGDPVDPTDPLEKTINTEEANKIISPQFIIASQNGVTLQRRFNVDTGSGANLVESAVTRCTKYYEDIYGPGRTVNGHWRLPTKAEIEYIQALQRNPASAVKSLLEGTKYWSGKSYWYYNFTGTNGSWTSDNSTSVAHIRCVFDIYKYE